MKNQAKHAEESLDRLKSIIDNTMKPSIEKAIKANGGETTEAIQQRSLMITDIQTAYEASFNMIIQNATALNDITRFVEELRANILMANDKMPKELFSEQVEIIEKALAPLIEWHDLNVKDYLTRKKGA